MLCPLIHTWPSIQHTQLLTKVVVYVRSEWNLCYIFDYISSAEVFPLHDHTVEQLIHQHRCPANGNKIFFIDAKNLHGNEKI